MNNKNLSFSKEINRENIGFKDTITSSKTDLTDDEILQNFKWLEQNSLIINRILF